MTSDKYARVVEPRAESPAIVVYAREECSRRELRCGTPVEIFSASTDEWVLGFVAPAEKNGYITIKFEVNNTLRRKHVRPESRSFRVFAEETSPEERNLEAISDSELSDVIELDPELVLPRMPRPWSSSKCRGDWRCPHCKKLNKMQECRYWGHCNHCFKHQPDEEKPNVRNALKSLRQEAGTRVSAAIANAQASAGRTRLAVETKVQAVLDKRYEAQALREEERERNAKIWRIEERLWLCRIEHDAKDHASELLQDVMAEYHRSGNVFRDQSNPLIPLKRGAPKGSSGYAAPREVDPERDWQLFRGNPQALDIKQKYLGDCWLLSPLMAVADRGDGYLVRSLFPGQNVLSPAGAYVVRLCIPDRTAPRSKWSNQDVDVYRGRWEFIVVDENLPYDFTSRLPLFCDSNRSTLWGSLVEKAYAKRRGSYEALHGSLASHGFFLLTGCPTYVLQTKSNPPDKILQWIRSALRRNYLMCASTGNVPIEKLGGLVPNHVYAIFGYLSVGGVDVVQFRNPHGGSDYYRSVQTSERQFIIPTNIFREGVWQGDLDGVWKGSLEGAWKGTEGVWKGTFRMAWKDVLDCFEDFTFCHVEDDLDPR